MRCEEPTLSKRRRASPVVKSAGRVLNILELFDDMGRDLSIGDVSLLLKYPQSSTSMLMHSLAELGFLRYNRALRTFTTTERVALLGTRRSGLTEEGQILRVMKRISSRAGCVVWLATRCGFLARDIHIVDEIGSRQRINRMDKVRHLLITGTGHALLSMHPDEELQLLVRRMIAERGDTKDSFDYPFVMKSIETIRRQGYCAVSGWMTPGIGVIVVPLPRFSREQPLVLGLRIPSAELNERFDFFLDLLRENLGGLCAIALPRGAIVDPQVPESSRSARRDPLPVVGSSNGGRGKYQMHDI
jgi:DNA-binding IclR family transcriptional regulator